MVLRQQTPDVPEGCAGREHIDDLRDASSEVHQHCRDFAIHEGEETPSFIERYKRGECCLALRRVEPIAGFGAIQDGFVFRALRANTASASPHHPNAFGVAEPPIKAADVWLHGNQPLMLSEVV